MKAITLYQPFAALIAIGAKRIETRSWSTNYRGPLAIHAAKGFPKWAKDLSKESPFSETLYSRFVGLEIWRQLPLGSIVATCELENCALITSHFVFHEGEEQERFFGDYTPGRYAWILTNVKALPEPVPAKGALGLWDCMSLPTWERGLKYGRGTC
jgi:hypothetical protein